MQAKRNFCYPEGEVISGVRLPTLFAPLEFFTRQVYQGIFDANDIHALRQGAIGRRSVLLAISSIVLFIALTENPSNE
ncbi:MAG: hypothetical protein HKN76_22000 [Saprospiraceae bacterium]|nr:hypothetical protein [Saprospiraceae bacterium]